MFSNLFFLILVLLTISMAPEGMTYATAPSPFIGFTAGIFVYALVLVLIYLQNQIFKRTVSKKKNILLFITNVELISFLYFYNFVVMGQRVFREIPYIHDFLILSSIFSLTLYFGGIILFHYSSFDNRKVIINNTISSSLDYALLQFRLIIPFVIPFLLFTFGLDLLRYYPNQMVNEIATNSSQTLLDSFLFIAGSLIFMIFIMMLLPYLIQKIWKCSPIEPGEIKEKLEALCHRAHFKHGGIKIWNVMNDSLTAAILGIVPSFRYIIFTKRILHELPPEALEAVLAHEIGHSYRKHLLIYPFIIMGIIMISGIFVLLFSDTIFQFLSLENVLHPSYFWTLLDPLLIILLYAFLIAVYVRLIFGYFSRLFERQADLHVYELQIPPQNMIRALDDVAKGTENSHKVPSWHHYSIQKRIDFLNATIFNPSLIAKHHKKVKWSLVAYFILFLIFIGIMIAPLAPETPPFKQSNVLTSTISSSLDNWVNDSLRQELAEKYMSRYHLKGNQILILDALKDSFKMPWASEEPGLLEFYAGINLYSKEEFSASATLLAKTWDSIDFDQISPIFLQILVVDTNELLQKISNDPNYQSEHSELLEANQKAIRRRIP